MAEDSDLERTEPASQRRLEQAREEGQVPQSRELSTFLVLLAGVAGLWVTGTWLGQRLAVVMTKGLTFSHATAFDSHLMGTRLMDLAGDALLALGPLFFAGMLAAVIGPVAMGGVVLSTKGLTPDFSRLDPMKGFGRMFSMQGVAELVKAVAKATIIGLLVWWVFRFEQEKLFSLFSTPLKTGVHGFMDLLLMTALLTVAGLALIAAMDVPFQLWQYHSRLKMTKEEMRQESKEQEGDPQVKGRIRAMQREMAKRRMMAEVPKADVVVTNPTHYSVALKYDADKMAAPRVVASGAGEIALKIREIARENSVPLLEAPPLARALFRHTKPGDQVPTALYTAVAEVMAYVYQLNAYLAQGGLPPKPPVDVAVPDGLDPGAEL